MEALLLSLWTLFHRLTAGLRHLLASSPASLLASLPSPASLLLLSSLGGVRAGEGRRPQVNSRSDHKQPNVLFIVADDLGWNDVSWHNPLIHSPVLEELAGSGVLLDQYYVQPTCSPSRVAMMTGKYPYRVGRQHMYIKPLMPTGIPANVPLMPQYFQQAGYTTHAIGKWHLGFCHQNYTPTYRGFDSFYGFYLGSQDYYLHDKHYAWESGEEKHKYQTYGYDFRFNENILKGREVQGKYSADLFVQRAQTIFKAHQKDAQKGKDTKPWFTYLSFQSVHEPLQVPHAYKRNVCRYRDEARYFYSAMVSSLDDAVDKVVKSLKETGQYNNTIIVFTTDNGGAVKVGGNNMPLRGTKGTLYEGGTRAIGFVHSPLLEKVGYTSPNLMHAVDWLPTLMGAIGRPGAALSATDGVDQWTSLSTGPTATSLPPRTELVYNIKEKPFMAAIRVGRHKLIWGSRTDKNVWFAAKEEPYNQAQCNITLRTRSQAGSLSLRGRKPVLVPIRGVDTMDVLVLPGVEDMDYWDEEEELERIQEIEGKELEQIEEEEAEESKAGAENKRMKRGVHKKDRQNQRKSRRRGRQRDKKKNNNGGGHKKNKGGGGGGKRGGGGKKKGSGNKKKNKNFNIPNDHGVKVRSFGELQLYDLTSDPNEKEDLAAESPELVLLLQHRIMEHFKHLRPRDCPPDSSLGDPVRWGGYYGPGWCNYTTVTLD